LRQVLINLLGNAVRFTDRGQVRLEVVQTAADTFEFAVTDTGVGIPPDALARIFEPFQQAHANASRGGSGLGLAIAQQHVRLMGGQIEVRSALDQGSTFTVTVPLKELAEHNERRHGGAPAWETGRLATGHDPRVLIVDDVAENRDVLAAMLKSVGCE